MTKENKVIPYKIAILSFKELIEKSKKYFYCFLCVIPPKAV